jgi:hypothetical protein
MTTRELATPVPVEGLGRLLDAVSEQRLAATVAALSSEMFAGRSRRPHLAHPAAG